MTFEKRNELYKICKENSLPSQIVTSYDNLGLTYLEIIAKIEESLGYSINK